MAFDTHTAAQIYVRLGNLRYALANAPDLEVKLVDNRLTVTCTTNGRREFITCARRPDDGGELWFFDHDRKPIIEAGNFTDAAVILGGRVRAATDA